MAGIFSLAPVIFSGFVTSWEQLLICRLVLGIGMGAKATTVPIFAAENSPAWIRGALVMSWQMYVAFGIFLYVQKLPPSVVLVNGNNQEECPQISFFGRLEISSGGCSWLLPLFLQFRWLWVSTYVLVCHIDHFSVLTENLSRVSAMVHEERALSEGLRITSPPAQY